MAKTGHETDACIFSTHTPTDSASLCLVAELVDDLGRGSDEREAGHLDLAREFRVFGQETVSESRLSALRLGEFSDAKTRTQGGSCLRRAREQS